MALTLNWIPYLEWIFSSFTSMRNKFHWNLSTIASHKPRQQTDGRAIRIHNASTCYWRRCNNTKTCYIGCWEIFQYRSRVDYECCLIAKLHHQLLTAVLDSFPTIKCWFPKRLNLWAASEYCWILMPFSAQFCLINGTITRLLLWLQIII